MIASLLVVPKVSARVAGTANARVTARALPPNPTIATKATRCLRVRFTARTASHTGFPAALARWPARAPFSRYGCATLSGMSGRWRVGGVVGPGRVRRRVVARGPLGPPLLGRRTTRSAASRETGAPTRAAMTTGFVVFGVAVPVYSRALRAALGGPAWMTAFATGIATLGVAAVPLGSPTRDTVHGWLAARATSRSPRPRSSRRCAFARSRPPRRGRARRSRAGSRRARACSQRSPGPAHGLFQRLGLGVGRRLDRRHRDRDDPRPGLSPSLHLRFLRVRFGGTSGGTPPSPLPRPFLFSGLRTMDSHDDRSPADVALARASQPGSSPRWRSSRSRRRAPRLRVLVRQRPVRPRHEGRSLDGVLDAGEASTEPANYLIVGSDSRAFVNDADRGRRTSAPEDQPPRTSPT